MISRAVALTERVIALVEAARAKTVAAVNLAMVYTYYEIGRQIVEEEQGGKRRAGYGETLLIDLSKKLTARFGRGWSVPNLKNIRLFYVVYSKRITDAEPTRAKKINTVYPIPEFTLSWSHYLKLMRIDDPDERAFYEIESRENNWSLRELQRQEALNLQRPGCRSLAVCIEPPAALQAPQPREGKQVISRIIETG